MKLRLHNYWRSSASYRVRIALCWKQLPFDYVAVHLVKDGGEQTHDGYRAKNPMAQVPTLEITEDDGTVHLLTQSVAIIEYLEERWPEPRLLPAAPLQRAQVRALVEVVNSGIQPLHNLSVTRKVKELGGDDAAWSRSFISPGLAAFADLAGRTAGRFSLGDRPTLADLFLVPQLVAARRFGVATSDFPLLERIEAACAALPAFADAAPERQPDAQPPTPAAP